MATRKSGGDIPTLLRDFNAHYPGNALKGAILLLRINRETDNWISPAMGLCPRYHPGWPSPWSHNVLITGPYVSDMSQIPILDCTIRTNDVPPKVDWNQKLSDSFNKPIDKQGRIYCGTVAEYCDPHVTLAGIKFLCDIQDAQRDAIVNAGTTLHSADYHYDIPGLLRELVRFASWDQLMLAPTPGLLFCSAFCQTAYMNVDQAYQFAKAVKPFPAVPPDLTTDDDVWCSPLGTRFPPKVPLPRKAALKSLYSVQGRRKGAGSLGQARRKKKR